MAYASGLEKLRAADSRETVLNIARVLFCCNLAREAAPSSGNLHSAVASGSEAAPSSNLQRDRSRSTTRRTASADGAGAEPEAVPVSLRGINIQQRWAQLLLAGQKTIEARKYPLVASGYSNEDLWIVQTTGKGEDASIVGVVRFHGCREYLGRASWRADAARQP